MYVRVCGLVRQSLVYVCMYVCISAFIRPSVQEHMLCEGMYVRDLVGLSG